MSHHRALLWTMALSTASLLCAALPRAYRWRWRLVVAATGLLVGALWP